MFLVLERRGVNIFIFLFNVFGSNLRHSHIGISYWKWLEFILISPAQHHLHHSVSKEHHDKNFGVSLAIWDWILNIPAVVNYYQFQTFPAIGSPVRWLM